MNIVDPALDLINATLRRQIARYTILATEVYITEKSLTDNERPLDKSKLERGMCGDYFFSSRYFQIKDHLSPEEYIPCSNIEEVRREFINRKVKVSTINLLNQAYQDQDDGETLYINKPLTEKELSELSKPFTNEQKIQILYQQYMSL